MSKLFSATSAIMAFLGCLGMATKSNLDLWHPAFLMSIIFALTAISLKLDELGKGKKNE